MHVADVMEIKQREGLTWEAVRLILSQQLVLKKKRRISRDRGLAPDFIVRILRSARPDLVQIWCKFCINSE